MSATHPEYSFALIPRAYSVAVYDPQHPINYVASCQIARYGDVGWMYSITGKGFYEAFAEPGTVKSLMDQAGVSTLEGYVVPSHARLMRAALRKSATVEFGKAGEMAGHKMVWVVVRAI